MVRPFELSSQRLFNIAGTVKSYEGPDEKLHDKLMKDAQWVEVADLEKFSNGRMLEIANDQGMPEDLLDRLKVTMSDIIKERHAHQIQRGSHDIGSCTACCHQQAKLGNYPSSTSTRSRTARPCI